MAAQRVADGVLRPDGAVCMSVLAPIIINKSGGVVPYEIPDPVTNPTYSNIQYRKVFPVGSGSMVRGDATSGSVQVGDMNVNTNVAVVTDFTVLRYGYCYLTTGDATITLDDDSTLILLSGCSLKGTSVLPLYIANFNRGRDDSADVVAFSATYKLWLISTGYKAAYTWNNAPPRATAGVTLRTVGLGQKGSINSQLSQSYYQTAGSRTTQPRMTTTHFEIPKDIAFGGIEIGAEITFTINASGVGVSHGHNQMNGDGHFQTVPIFDKVSSNSSAIIEPDATDFGYPATDTATYWTTHTHTD